ncbi:HEAT repeat domain-containing protein [candidate division WOR-3 bacterium]|nr:HEAT repeat domain-containing protein [candidate division WOR-3 bacterium]
MKHISDRGVSVAQAQSHLHIESAVKLLFLATLIVLLILGFTGKAGEPQIYQDAFISLGVAEASIVQHKSQPSSVAAINVDSLIGMLSDSSPMARWQAVYALSESPDPRAVEPLIDLIDDPEPDVRWRVVRGLGNFNDSRVVDPLLYCLSDDEELIRVEAVRSLGKVGDKRAVRMLCLLTLDEDIDIRAESVRALGMIKDYSSVSSLEDALGDESLEVREEAARALSWITGKLYEVDEGEEGLPIEVNVAQSH